MRKATVQTGRRAAFTLIEILLAMAIMAVICGTIYQFTGTTVRVADVAMRVEAREQAFGGLRRLLAAQLAALPASESGAFVGENEDGKHGRKDALQLLCPAGSAILTPDARGLYQVTFELREHSPGSGNYFLVLNREPWADNSELESDLSGGFKLPAVSAGGFRTTGTAGALESRPAGWVRLLDGVRSLEFDYFDPRLNAWVDKWNDPTMAPSLVRVRLAMENGGAAYEFVEKVPGGGTPRALLTAATLPVGPGLPNGGFPVNGGTPPANGRSAPPTGAPPGPPPTLPPGVRPPSGPPPTFDPTRPLVLPSTGDAY